ncbi:hypothetical protein Tco_0264666 [Tanacetum coccineum]
MMLDSINEGLLVYPTVVGEDGQTRPKNYYELTEAQQLQDDCDVQATNIILHGLPPDVYSLGETLYEYYWRFSQLINDMHTIGMTMLQEKLMLVEAQEVGQILDEEQLAFIADPGIAEAQVAQQTIPQNSAFETEDLDAYESIDVQEMPYSEQTHIVDFPDNEITSDSNIIPYS